jgi:hypothetical protein
MTLEEQQDTENTHGVTTIAVNRPYRYVRDTSRKHILRDTTTMYSRGLQMAT